MSVLILDYGTTNLDVYCQRGGHALPRQVGRGRSLSFNGVDTASARAELMVVPVVLSWLSPSVVATIRTLFANGNQVPCRGDVFNAGAVTVTCSGTLADDFHPIGPWFEGSMTLYEVGTGLL